MSSGPCISFASRSDGDSSKVTWSELGFGLSASVIEDEDFIYHRDNSASADLVTGTNYPVAISHNQQDGTFEQTGALWWQTFLEAVEPTPEGTDFDHVTGAFIGGGGN